MGFSLDFLNTLGNQFNKAGSAIGNAAHGIENWQKQQDQQAAQRWAQQSGRPASEYWVTKAHNTLSNIEKPMLDQATKIGADVADIPATLARAGAVATDVATAKLQGQTPRGMFSNEFLQAINAKLPSEQVGQTPEAGLQTGQETLKGIGRPIAAAGELAQNLNPTDQLVRKLNPAYDAFVKNNDNAVNNLLAKNPNAAPEAQTMGNVAQGVTEMAGYEKALSGATALADTAMGLGPSTSLTVGDGTIGATHALPGWAEALTRSGARILGATGVGQLMNGDQNRSGRALSDLIVFTGFEGLFTGVPLAYGAVTQNMAESGMKGVAADVLGVKPNATPEEVTAAYNNLYDNMAKSISGPDAQQLSQEEMQAVKEAMANARLSRAVLTGEVTPADKSAANWMKNFLGEKLASPAALQGEAPSVYYGGVDNVPQEQGFQPPETVNAEPAPQQTNFEAPQNPNPGQAPAQGMASQEAPIYQNAPGEGQSFGHKNFTTSLPQTQIEISRPEAVTATFAKANNPSDVLGIAKDMGVSISSAEADKIASTKNEKTIGKILGNAESHHITLMTGGKTIPFTQDDLSTAMAGTGKTPIYTDGKFNSSAFQKIETLTNGKSNITYEAPIEKVLTDTTLFDSEPWLKNYKVQLVNNLDGALGETDPVDKVIRLDVQTIGAYAGNEADKITAQQEGFPADYRKIADTKKMGTLIHEIVHAIQENYGFHGGSNTVDAQRIFEDNSNQQIVEREKQIETNLSNKNASTDQVAQENKKLQSEINIIQAVRDKALNKADNYLGMYRDVFGEAEARDFAARIGMSAEESASHPPMSLSGSKPEELMKDIGPVKADKFSAASDISLSQRTGNSSAMPENNQPESKVPEVLKPVVNPNAQGPNMEASNAGNVPKEFQGSIDRATDSSTEFVRDVIKKAAYSTAEMEKLFQDDAFKAAVNDMAMSHGYEKTVRWIQSQYNAVAKGEVANKLQAIQDNPLFKVLKNSRVKYYLDKNGELPEHFGKKGSKSSLDELAQEYGMDAEPFRAAVEKLYNQFKSAKAGLTSNIEDLMDLKMPEIPDEPTPEFLQDNVFPFNEDIYGSAPQKWADIIKSVSDMPGADVSTALKSLWGIDPPSAHDARFALLELASHSPSIVKPGRAKFFDVYSVKSATGVLTEFGSFGGNLVMKGKFATDVARDVNQIMTPKLFEADQLFKKEAGKNQFARLNLAKRVYDALADRDNSADYLHNKNEVRIYEIYKSILDWWKEKKISLGQPVRENYATQIGDIVNKFRDLSSASKLPDDVSSRFNEARTNMEAYNGSKDIQKIVRIYNSVMIKDLAFSDLLDFYNQNVQDIPPHLKQVEDFGALKNYMEKWMTQLLNPDITSKEHRFMARFLSTVYNNMLWNNAKSTMKAYTRRYLSDAMVSKEAQWLRKNVPADIKSEILKSMSPYESNDFKELPVSVDKAKAFIEQLKKFDMFKWMVKKNWDYSGLNGYMQTVSNSGTYQKLVAQGVNRVEALRQALATEKGLAERAFVNGVAIMDRSQIGANRATQPAFWRSKEGYFFLPKNMLTMMKRYSYGLFEIFYKAMSNPGELRESIIYSGGSPEESFIVDSRRMAELVRIGAENILERVKAKDPAFAYTDEETAKEYLKFTKSLEDEFKEKIKEIQPTNPRKIGWAWAKMTAAGLVITYLFNNMAVAIGTKDAKYNTLANNLSSSIPGVPSTDPNRLIMPTLWPSNSLRSNIALGMNLVPGLGAVNRLTGNALSEGTAELLGAKPYKNNSGSSAPVAPPPPVTPPAPAPAPPAPSR